MPPRLKSLELHGYKTFASKSTFEFPGMVTAIVGPNGSGKSNVADALRWVLGEQSYSLLRGKKTEDMIFAGSEQRPRAGMASASITFDNSDNWLPIDFSEVSITRRAYRDGQNEYLLNGQRVRLKEISELLAQSGLAERTYTIIGQGLVDAALALKPEERRRLFEEAAGISLYRTRKEDALNRLESTRRNLDRVQDIIAELEPRLLSLEKQARRVMEYERIKADLKLLLRDWYGYHWHRSQIEVNRSREIVRNQAIRLEENRKRHQELSEQLGKAKTKIQSLRQQLNDWYNQSAELNTQLEKTGRSLAILDERQKALTDQQMVIQSDLIRLDGENQENTEILNSTKADQDKLKAEFAEASDQIEKVKKTLQSRMTERSKIERLLRETRQALVNQETRQVQIKAHREELQHRLVTEQNNFQTNLRSIETLSSEQAKLKKDFDVFSAKKQENYKQLQDASTNWQSVLNQISGLENELKNLNSERSKYETEKAKIKAQLEVIEQAEKSLTGFSEGARFINQSFTQGRLRGTYQAIGNLIRVPAEFELAVTAALGEFLDLIVLGGDTETEMIFQFLENYNRGKVALLPAEWMTTRTKSMAFPDDPDCLGIASDKVDCEELVRPVINRLLDRVLIANDRKAARRMILKSPDAIAIVTLKGEVFTESGLVVLGQAVRSGTISRQRQKAEFTNSLKKINLQIESLQSSSDQIGEKLSEIRSQEKSMAGRRLQFQKELERISGEHNRLSLTLDQSTRQVEWLTNQKTSLSEAVKKTQEEIDQLKVSSSQCENEIKQASSRVQEHQITLRGFSLDDLQNEMNRWETEKAVITRALKDINERIDERTRLIDKTGQRRISLEKRVQEIDASIVSIHENLVVGKLQEAKVIEQIHTLQNLVQPAQTDLNGLERKNEDLQKSESAAQQSLTVIERYYSQAQADMARQREAMDSLRRRIEEDFGLVAFEYESNVSGPTPLPFEGMVEQLPVIKELPSGLEENIARQKNQLRRIGAVNPEALTEYKEVQDRHQFITSQVADLHKAEGDLREVISELDDLMKRDFRITFDAVAEEFHQTFKRLFDGGSARLVLDDEENLNETGIDIEARLPGRREQGLSLLSGGERSLTAAALVFALLKVSPTPFCVMDEVDAMLDESNVARFCTLLEEQSKTTQFVVITHNRNTVKVADVVYGITMGKDSVSQAISLKLDEVTEEMVN